METSLSPAYSMIAAAGVLIGLLLLLGSLVSLKDGARIGVAGLALALLETPLLGPRGDPPVSVL